MEKKAITKNMKRFWGTAEVTEGIIGQVNALYFSVFLTDIAKLPMIYYSAVMMITSIVDFLLAPVAGGIVSGTKAMKWGRLRSWVVIGPPIIAVTLMMEYIYYGNHYLLAAISVTFFYLANLFFSNVSWAANVALIPTISEGRDREILAANRMTGSNIGRLLGGYTAPLLLMFLVSNFGIKIGYPSYAFISALFLVFGYSVHFMLSKGYEIPAASARNNEQIDDGRLNFKEIWHSLINNPNLFPVMLADMTSTLSAFLLPSLIVYMYTYVLGNPYMVSVHMLVTGIGGLCGAYLSRYLVQIFTPRNACLIVYPITSVLLFGLRFAMHNIPLFIIMSMFINFFIEMTQPMESLLYMDCIIYNKWKTGVDASGFIMGMMNVPTKFSIIIKSAILSIVFSSIGYIAGMAPTVQLQQGLINAYTVVPTIIPLIGFISLRFFYKLDKKRIEEMKTEIAARN